MSAPKLISEREAVLRERAAYRQGAVYQESRHRASLSCNTFVGISCAGHEAATRYPLPKIERPRIVRDPEQDFPQDWRVVDGKLEFAPDGARHENWIEYAAHVRRAKEIGGCLTFTVKRLALWADLFANPTELVEDDDSASSRTGGQRT